MRLIDGGKMGEGDPARSKRTGEAGHIIHVFGVYPFKGNVVVVLVGERRELCSVDELEKAETWDSPSPPMRRDPRHLGE